MGRVTPKGIQILLGGDSRQRAGINAYRPVTPEGLNEILGDPNVKRDPFSFQHRLKGGINGGAYGTNGDHVGRDLKGKTAPESLDREGPDPIRDREFVGDEFQGMLMFAPNGKPAFQSLWPEGTADKDKTLRINIASKLPDYIANPESVVHQELSVTDALEKQPVEQIFKPVHANIRAAVDEFAKSFEANFGVKVDVQVDHPNPHVSVMGYDKGRKDITAFSSFPAAMGEWKKLKHASHSPGYLFVSSNRSKGLGTDDSQRLVNQQLGLALGVAHPHDLAQFRNLSDQAALTMTTMAYSDLKPVSLGTEDKAGFGPLDFGLRKWLPNAPALNEGEQALDLEMAYKESLRRNADTVTYKETGLLPAVSLFAHGEDNMLMGGKGDDYLDTNAGYVSTYQDPETGRKQNAVLVEGHIRYVECGAGNNIVVAAKDGDQTIHTGTGKTDVRLLYPEMSGEKVIDAPGEVTVTFTASQLKSAQDVTVSQSGDDFVLGSAQGGSLRLQGQAKGEGISSVRMLSESGRVLFEKEVKGLSLDDFRKDVLEPAKKTAAEYVPSKPDVAQDRPSTWKERVERLQKEAEKAGNSHNRYR